MISRRLSAVALALIISLLPAPAWAGFDSGNDDDGALVGMSREQVASLPRKPGDPLKPGKRKRTYEYEMTTACIQAQPGAPGADLQCANSFYACVDSGGPGPLSRIWRRTIEPGEDPTAWQVVGTTCHTDVGPASRPMLTLAMVQREFKQAPWAKPTVSMQPKGNVTLIGLPAYYKVGFAKSGFGPGETLSTTILGFGVEIRPRAQGYVYRFGDGTSFGPTPNAGGTYPNGTMTHTYTEPGPYDVSITAVYDAQFRVSGGAWIDIQTTIDVTGPVQTLIVREARAQLIPVDD